MGVCWSGAAQSCVPLISAPRSKFWEVNGILFKGTFISDVYIFISLHNSLLAFWPRVMVFFCNSPSPLFFLNSPDCRSFCRFCVKFIRLGSELQLNFLTSCYQWCHHHHRSCRVMFELAHPAIALSSFPSKPLLSYFCIISMSFKDGFITTAMMTMWECVWAWCVSAQESHGAHLEARGQLWRVGSQPGGSGARL